MNLHATPRGRTEVVLVIEAQVVSRNVERRGCARLVRVVAVRAGLVTHGAAKSKTADDDASVSTIHFPLLLSRGEMADNRDLVYSVAVRRPK
jgi:hypothetical protein